MTDAGGAAAEAKDDKTHSFAYAKDDTQGTKPPP